MAATNLVDGFLAEAELGDGERSFLTALRKSSMRLYEVVDAVPGVSLTLRDAIEGDQVTVRERTGSRMIGRHEYVAARVVPRGPSGGPEIEAGLLHMPGLVKDSVAEQLREHRARFLEEHRGVPIDELYKTMPPFFHDVWVGSFLDPYVPTPKTTDGEDMIPTEVQFDVSDGDAVSRALDDHPEIDRNEEIWTWSGRNREGKTITLGTLERRGERLVLETMSVERADRGRAMLESIVGSALRHRATSHENLQRALKERLRAKYLRGEDSEPDEPVGDHGLPPEMVERLILGHYTTRRTIARGSTSQCQRLMARLRGRARATPSCARQARLAAVRSGRSRAAPVRARWRATIHRGCGPSAEAAAVCCRQPRRQTAAR